MPLFDRPPIDAISVSNNLFSSGTFRMTGGPFNTVGSDVSGASISVDPNPDLAAWRNFEQQDAVLLTNVSQIFKTPFYFGEVPEGDIKLGSIGFKASFVTNNTLQSFSLHFGVYTRVNSTSMALLGSASDTYNISSASSSSFTKDRNIVMTSPGTHTAISTLSGGGYVFGMMISAGAGASANFSLYGAGGSAAVSASSPTGVIRPGANQFSTGSTQGMQPLMGRGISTVNALPANVVASELVNQTSGSLAPLRPWILMRS